ncbi:MAG: hypothetical protein ACYDEV_11625 [Acidiferrobacter sp.]
MLNMQNSAYCGRWILLLILPSTTSCSDARQLTLAIQPILREGATRKAFAPLAHYIGQVLGQPCKVATNPNFIAYWQMIRKKHGYAFVFDAAHFTDFDILLALSLRPPLLRAGKTRIPSCQQRPTFSHFD